MRGNRFTSLSRASMTGPIPACAGQPYSYCHSHLTVWAHPRVCGATRMCSPRVPGCLGPSPRVRGNRDFSSASFARVGPIPACAGQPLPSPCRQLQGWAHPRVCGATHGLHHRRPGAQGPSPRVRGNPWGLVSLPPQAGPIPACAGQPWLLSSWALLWWAHPRVCGATGPSSIGSLLSRGPSPRVRGNPKNVEGKNAQLGPIPACAGQPGRRCPTPMPPRAHPRVCGATFATVSETVC